MSMDEIISGSGLSSLYKVYGNQQSGLILEDVATGEKKFYASRKHQFTPLATIGIYTFEDTIPLKDVFLRFFQEATLPATTESDKDLHTFFGKVVPEYDPDRVRTSDIRKMLKWFQLLQKAEVITPDNLKEEPAQEKAE